MKGIKSSLTKKYLFALIGILSIVFLFCLVGALNNYKEISVSSNSNLEINQNCSGLNLFKTSYCINKEVKDVSYNISNRGKDLSKEDFLKQGGVCLNFANYIEGRFLELGAKMKNNNFQDKEQSKFYITTKVFSIDKKTSHVILIASNEEGYCIFSNQYVNCKEFNNEN